MSQGELPPVLTASVHDVRYLAALLRGVNFVNRATVTVTKRGLTISVEEARTLLGTAFVFAEIFDEYVYHADGDGQLPTSSQNSDDEGEADNAAFEIPLNILIDCLNIFGTAGPATSSSSGGGTGNYKRWRQVDEDGSDDTRDDGDNGGRGRGGGGGGRRGGGGGGGGSRGAGGTIETYLGGGTDKATSMRMSYAGAGYPLTLLIAEDASGPTTTCEITTFDPEPQLELEFDNSAIVLKIILKSSWLRDALSELDPSCDKLTFIGNPPVNTVVAPNGGQRQQRNTTKPMLRIQAGGTFGSTEMDYPNDRDVLETFECTRSVSFSYRFGHISRTLRALQSSTKTSLRIDEEGLLSLQFLMPSPKSAGGGPEFADAFIEFRCLALDDEL
ncbi:uncharacterized protein LACBIDRAFT_315835 [Laccaria bicolor S238N-H82]|uniref:Predicted protein n=1 Tax=Laccaria bicolor (strain S238N-H82 / ATCC MYA-4686) TaxID=486041 RepID=B0D3A8_LACBS|nr:uncharacterized protein LACBIDRAFT_315835 [Laccaria bicolor S238N-H82]EDR10882.1 predicted protein [Laccaria bicolor S238N-H82]|eukprot:XP_001878183.1 predicted protein [Laccaria bicolor S238N-H82]